MEVEAIAERTAADQFEVVQALRQREQQLAEAQRVAQLGSWEWDIATNRVSWSDELYRIFDLEPHELEPTYEGYLAHVHPDDRAVANEEVGAALHAKDNFEYVARVVRSGGEVGWIRARGEVVRDDTGAPVRMSGTAQDVTASKQAEEALARTRDEAMESSRLKSQFLATMSHEIRTPMNGVIGLTGLLLGTELDDRQRQYAEGVKGAGQALLAIINDILDFSKIEAGKLELEVVDFTLADVVEEAAGLVASAAQRKGLELVAYCFPGLPAGVRGDPARLRQVLLNLASNAVKFTEHGEVVVRARLVDESDQALVVRFEVVDTGIGIAEVDTHRLFDPFSQADASTTRRFGGTGLGLAISRQLVALMGGDLGVESEVGRGSTFWFTLPLGRPAHGNEAPSRPFHHPLHGLRVLVVDDNDTNRLILHEQLGAWDMCPDPAEDGMVALERLREAAQRGQPYDLVLLDMCMPGMDGLELARRIAADPELAATCPVLLSSAATLDGEEARQAGIAACLTKPVRLSQLYDSLMRATAPPPVDGQKGPLLPEPRKAGIRGHVLVVEDNATNQMVATGILDDLGYRVDVAANGLEALEALARTDYAAVLMDCQMPEMDGYTATGEIRLLEGELRRTPVIAMTAGAIEGDRDRCLEAGMDDYISKPVKPEDVDATLSRWVGEGRKHRVGPSAGTG